jgi:diaminopimelate epimerase
MAAIPFIKASACGNDFLLVERGTTAEADLAELTRRMCDRNEGVGADGVEWLSADPHADVRAHLVNADGSEAELSGNGTRCVAAYAASREGKKSVDVRTGAGIKTCTLARERDGVYDFEIAMGEPEVGDEFTIKVAFGAVSGVPVSMGNPHFVRFVESFKAGWQADAAEIGKHHDFKHGINVELVKVRDEHNLEVRFFERGAGETRSSGTGSCASAVASIFAGKAKSPVSVHAQGGTQIVRWEKEVFLSGSARLVCKGEFFV